MIGLELAIALDAGAAALDHEAERLAGLGLRMSAMELAHYAAVLRGARSEGIEDGAATGLEDGSSA